MMSFLGLLDKLMSHTQEDATLDSVRTAYAEKYAEATQQAHLYDQLAPTEPDPPGTMHWHIPEPTEKDKEFEYWRAGFKAGCSAPIVGAEPVIVAGPALKGCKYCGSASIVKGLRGQNECGSCGAPR